MIILLYNVVLNVLNKKQKKEVNAKAEFTTLAKRTTSFTSNGKYNTFRSSNRQTAPKNIMTTRLFHLKMLLDFNVCD